MNASRKAKREFSHGTEHKGLPKLLKKDVDKEEAACYSIKVPP